jgi:alpha-glucosidase
MNSGELRTLSLSLDFLASGQAYMARIYSDDPQAPGYTKVKITDRQVDSNSVLECRLSAQGGQALRIIPLANR